MRLPYQVGVYANTFVHGSVDFPGMRLLLVYCCRRVLGTWCAFVCGSACPCVFMAHTSVVFLRVRVTRVPCNMCGIATRAIARCERYDSARCDVISQGVM